MKKPSTISYGGRSRGKKNYGNGGFNNQPTVSYEHISQEQWDTIFGKKETKEECQTKDN